ncbi:MAG TPA: TolC family protein, partial [Flavilitoribacter sp.]|nr:TolC family protein [Flavilitoribacter sp.]
QVQRTAISVTTAILLILAAGALKAQTLDDYIRIALDNNPGIRARQAEYQAASQKAPQAGAMPDPTLNASFFLGHMILPEGNQLGSVSAMQMIPWPGTLKAMKEEANRSAEVSRQSVGVLQNDLVFMVRNAWFPMVELEQKIRVQQEKLRVLETDKDLAVLKFQQGLAPMADAIRADVMIDEAKTSIRLFELKRRSLTTAFNSLLNRDGDAPVSMPGGAPEAMPRPAPAEVDQLNNNPGLALIDRQIKAAAAGEKAASFQRKPVFSAGIQYMPLAIRTGIHDHIEPNTGQDMIMPMISMTIPIWKKKYDAAVKERRLLQVAYSEMKKDRHNDLAALFEATRYELEEAIARIDLLNVQMEKIQQVIDLQIAAYANSGQDFKEVLDLQQQLFDYRTDKISAQTGYQLALAKLDYLTGKNAGN